MRHGQEISQTEVMWLPQIAKTQFAPQLATGLRWLSHVLEEAEQALDLPHATKFDLPIKDRLRRSA